MPITKTKIEGSVQNADMFNITGSPKIIRDNADELDMRLESQHWQSIGCQVISQTADRFLVADESGDLLYLIDLL